MTISEPPIDTRARDAAIEQVEAGADVVVLHDLREAVRALAATTTHFTTDDIQIPRAVREPRVLGAVMLWAQKQGFVEATGNYRQSRNRECHNRPKMVWRSLVFSVSPEKIS